MALFRIPGEAVLTSIVRLKIEQTWIPKWDNWASLWFFEQEATEGHGTCTAPKSQGRWGLWLLPEKSSILPHRQPDRKPVPICPTEKSLAHTRKPNVAAARSLMAGHLRRLYPKVCFPSTITVSLHTWFPIWKQLPSAVKLYLEPLFKFFYFLTKIPK